MCVGDLSVPKRFLGACFLMTALAACGGGGGNGGPPGGGIVPTTAPTGTPTPGITTTTASGSVIDDGTSAPKSGVKVVLRPWVACTTPTPTTLACPTPLPAPQATTDALGNFTLANAPNGHYFLVIGDDTPGTNVTTVHANVTLSGGTVALVAPVLPPIPTYTPPATEAGGKYRIRALDPTTEVPCITEFNAKRAATGLPQLVADEWLLENVIGWNANRLNGSPSSPPWPGNANGGLADGLIAGAGATCLQMVDGTYGGSLYADPRTQWYGAHDTFAYGSQQVVIDPATQASTKGVVWP
jgi:hypothetical protein